MAGIQETQVNRVALATGSAGDGTGNAVPISTTNPLPITMAGGGVAAVQEANNADGRAASATANKQSVVSYGYVFNGSNWDRQRGDTAGTYINGSIFFTESTAALAASATFNGATRANGGVAGGLGSRFCFFTAEAFSDVAGGTLYIDKSVDGGTTWRQVGSVALAAGTSVSLKVPISAASYRARVVNGATPMGAALFTASYTLN